jgi:thiamine kinase
MTPAEIAAGILGIDAGEVIEVEPIKHGLTNESWRVLTRTDTVVVRVSNTSEQILQIDRDSEASILGAVSRAGIGAEVLLCDPARRLLITRHLGEAWTYDEARSSARIRPLASLLQRLHQLPIPSGVRGVDLASMVEGYLHTLDRHGEPSELRQPSLRKRAAETAQSLQERSVARLCHNDVHHLNIVGTDSLRLIDWEYGGAGEPLFDLASVCIYHRYSEDQREALLSGYTREPDALFRQRLELACWLFDYVRDLWFAVRAVTQGAAP